MLKVYKRTFNNGLRALVIPVEHNPTVTTIVMTATGSNNETKEISGISHFLEHLHFKGTKKRPKAQIISEEFDNLGSSSNAYTTNEMTAYYAVGDSNSFKKILDLISDMYLNSAFPKEEIEKEKGVIVEEINMYEDMPSYQAGELLDELLYGDQPVGRSVAGNKESVKKMTREDFVDYKNKNYVAEKTVVVVSGNVNKKEVFKEIENKFKDIPVNKGAVAVRTKENQTKPMLKIKDKKTDQTHLSFGFRTFSYKNIKKNNTLSLLSIILGGSMSSRLFLKLRGEMGVAYYASSGKISFKDCGYLRIKAGINNGRTKESVQEIINECQKLAKGEIEEKELKKAKRILISRIKISLESTEDIANFFGHKELLLREIVSPVALIKDIKKITLNDVKKLAKDIFKNENLNLAIVGSVKNKEEIKKICKFC